MLQALSSRRDPGRWTRELVIAAMLEWRDRYGGLPSSYDWSRTHARRRGGEALERLVAGEWPAASMVTAAVRGLGCRPCRGIDQFATAAATGKPGAELGPRCLEPPRRLNLPRILSFPCLSFVACDGTRDHRDHETMVPA